MKIAVRHELRVGIAEGAGRAALHLLLTPRTGPTQVVREWRIDVEGLDDAAGFTDGFGNRAHLVTQTRPGPALTVVASGMIETTDTAGVLGRPMGEPPAGLFRRRTALATAEAELAEEFRPQMDNRIGLFHALMAKVGENPDVKSSGSQSQSQSQSQSGGGSQSQSQSQSMPPTMIHRFIGVLRSLDIPARYVTGYALGDESEEASFHGWAEAFDERLGWIGFDPTMQLCPADRHVRMAVGMDGSSAAPVRVVPAAGEAQSITVSVEAAQ